MESVLKTSRKQISKNIKAMAGYSQNVLVYGCGRFVDNVKEKLGDKVKGWEWFDPYVDEFAFCPYGHFEHVILDNVLNVIRNDEELLGTLQHAYQKVKSGGWLSIAIYEGDRSGVATFGDGKCQRNQTVGEYAPFFAKLNFKELIKISGGVAIRKD